MNNLLIAIDITNHNVFIKIIKKNNIKFALCYDITINHLILNECRNYNEALCQKVDIM